MIDVYCISFTDVTVLVFVLMLIVFLFRNSGFGVSFKMDSGSRDRYSLYQLRLLVFYL